MRHGLTILFCAGVLSGACAAEYSDLWGVSGEKWSPQSRLPDFSFAGYHRGEKPLPDVAQKLSVKDFGAMGDGKQDDSDAFLKAIAAAHDGAIYIPAGKYVITKILEVTKPNIVLRGAGRDKTTLYFPTPLNDIRPDWGATTSGQRTSNYSWSGGFIWVRGSLGQKSLAKVTSAATRGSTQLKVSTIAGFAAGQQIEIALRDDKQKSLLNELYSGDPADITNIPAGRHKTSQICVVTRIGDSEIAFDRPLRMNIDLAWEPEIRSLKPSVSEVGIEDLAFEFPARKYGGHFSELGYNAFAFGGVTNCWARRVTIINSDSGFFASGAFCTIQDVIYELRGVPQNALFGHHGAQMTGLDNLFTNFEFNQKFVHDMTVEGGSGNVFANGKGIDLCFDHHERAPYENLFTNIDLGAGTRMWHSGGGAKLGRHCGARGTFWNIRANHPQSHPGAFGPASMNLIALSTNQPSIKQPEGKWFEAIPPDKLEPQDLHSAQLARRMAASKQN